MENKNKKNAHKLTYHPKERMDLFRDLSVAEQSVVFKYLSPHVEQSILEKLKDGEMVDLLDEMDLQRASNVLTRLKNEKRRNRIISRLKEELKEKAEYFLRFHPKAALNLLNFNYLLLSSDTTIGETADLIENHYRETAKSPEILVHEDGEFTGEVLVGDLVRESNSDSLKKHIVSVKTISYQADVQDIINVFSEAKHGKVVVLDRDGSVIGIIYSEDALSLLESRSSSTLYDFAGVSKRERAFDSIWSKVGHRYKWLIINLGTAFLAAFVVNLFKDTLSQIIVLAVYMPIIAGMGGNAGTQTLAVIIRGITIGEISLKNSAPAILREVGAGFINGAINGIIVAVVATLLGGNPLLGLVLAVAMVFNLVVAGFFGAFIPLFMKSIGKDPAASATIFITTATDVFGFFVFLGLASLLLL